MESKIWLFGKMMQPFCSQHNTTTLRLQAGGGMSLWWRSVAQPIPRFEAALKGFAYFRPSSAWRTMGPQDVYCSSKVIGPNLANYAIVKRWCLENKWSLFTSQILGEVAENYNTNGICFGRKSSATRNPMAQAISLMHIGTLLRWRIEV